MNGMLQIQLTRSNFFNDFSKAYYRRKILYPCKELPHHSSCVLISSPLAFSSLKMDDNKQKCTSSARNLFIKETSQL